MKKLVSTLLFAAIPVFAQTPAAPDAPAAPASPHMHGGPWGRHVPAPVTGAPYTAQITTTGSMKLQDGTPVTNTATRTIYRDSQGRTREEVTLPARAGEADAASGQPRTAILIFDPVANTFTRLNPQQKSATVTPLPPAAFTHAEKRVDHEVANPQWEGKNATVTSLGTKTIAGVNATGERIVHAVPEIAGAPAGQTVTRETWFSPELKIELSSTETDPVRGTRSSVVTSLNRAEPDPSLFQVPAGYTVRQGAEHGPRGMHRGGANDAPEPPPEPPSGE